MSTAALPWLDAELRGGTVAVLLLLAILLLRNARSAASRYGAFLALSTACYAIISSPGVFYLRAWWLLPLRLASLGNPALFWLFAVACFDDEYRPSWRDAAVWLVSVAFGAGCVFFDLPVGGLLFQAMQLVFVGLAVGQALTGRNADLVEGRRRFRVVIVVATAVYIVVLIVLEWVSRGPVLAGSLSPVNAGGLFILVFFIAVRLLSLPRSDEFFPLAAPVSAAAAPEPAPVADAHDAPLLGALRRLMEEERVYRAEGLSIAALALKMELPEYRLRRLINQRLGHRNFSSFVNRYRLEDAMAALRDPLQAEVPILTIALDAGFQSLGPFNRAFKAETGLTPSDYRRRQLTAMENRA